MSPSFSWRWGKVTDFRRHKPAACDWTGATLARSSAGTVFRGSIRAVQAGRAAGADEPSGRRSAFAQTGSSRTTASLSACATKHPPAGVAHGDWRKGPYLFLAFRVIMRATLQLVVAERFTCEPNARSEET